MLSKERMQVMKWFVLSLGILLGMALAGGVALAGSGSVESPGKGDPQAIPSGCGLAWRHVDSPSFLDGTTTVEDVDALAANDIWAVGSYSDGSISKTLTMHWDGTAWTILYSPNAGSSHNYLNGVKVLSHNDVWAVGTYAMSLYKTLALHWNGTAWSIAASPNAGTGSNILNEIDAIPGSNQMWAVGYYYDGSTQKTLTMRWSGSSWTIQTSANPSTTVNELDGVTAVGFSDAWAVGNYKVGSETKTLTLHWDGTTWSTVASPNVPGAASRLYNVDAVAANDIWAVGNYSLGLLQTLIMHWNGSAWTILPSPNVEGLNNYLNDVIALSASDVWAVGTSGNVASGYSHSLTLHWNGSTWSIVSSPSSGTYTSLSGITEVSATDLWAVGSYSEGNRTLSLSMHWDGTAWAIVESPNSGPYENVLYDIEAVSANDIWAVGNHANYEDPQNPDSDSLVMHWNGSAWSVVQSPNVGNATYLQGVDVIAANDAWAVGFYFDASNLIKTLTIHWNGSAWSVVQSPNEGTGTTALLHVAAISSNNVWAVGYSTSASIQRTLIMRWDGLGWSTISSPNVGVGNNALEDVEAISASDMWAVGFSTNAGIFQTLAMHWNGSIWSVVATPNVGTSSNFLAGVGALSTNDVWAVGNYNNGPNSSQTLTMHWNGAVWSIVTSSNGGSQTNIIFDVEVLGPSDAWAVGYYNNLNSSYTMLMLHWNGSGWSVVGTPDVGAAANLYGITAVSGSNVWASGYFSDGAYSIVRTLTMQYSDPCSTPTPTATVTPGGPTATATPVGTACTIQFTDVPMDSTFYPFIHCLACRGIINGYPDGTFKPANNVTRGQLSKIISNAAGFSDPQTSQMFEDVPVGSTFQEFVGRLASRGYISGYPCGGAGEPCVAPGNLPYFRPNANATRGQITKIDANAAEFNDTPSGQQFEDIVTGSTFYTFTYRLATRSIMSGYPCGGAGEPCVAPGNLPYFRPNDNATRGQTSKVVANTFFPSCSTP